MYFLTITLTIFFGFVCMVKTSEVSEIAEVAEVACPNGHHFEPGVGCIKILQFDEPGKTWVGARASCLKENSDLISPTTEAELQNLQNVLLRRSVAVTWLGIHGENGQWTSADGKPVSAEGEWYLKNVAPQGCLILTNKLDSLDCNRPLGLTVCKAVQQPAGPVAPPQEQAPKEAEDTCKCIKGNCLELKNTLTEVKQDFIKELVPMKNLALKISNDLRDIKKSFEKKISDLQNEINKAKNCEKEVKNITTQRKTYELYYTKDGKNWSEAQKACEEHHANLVIINSKKEEGHINNLMSEKGAKDTWLGARMQDDVDEPVVGYSKDFTPKKSVCPILHSDRHYHSLADCETLLQTYICEK